ncbi:aminotransferase class V-fold PLP-dependent enzyme [Desulfosediminicola flagellatus]|uniref:aminotransferase class V-fold PLP-dependent enzyme n=1 Tax=Desulfosediminicola flagellatus TaxID=2569541 RepID=UPI0010AB73B7|nr:aminotransferase class V-fold PLP-dependent enzyme [Desulfosediminicola flagellatus]
MIDKCSSLFKNMNKKVFLGHCAISPLFSGSLKAIEDFSVNMAENGVIGLLSNLDLLPKFHTSAARLMKTQPENISFVQNTATAMSMIAGGYPFEPGDQIISYQHEYPSNHYPWVIQRSRGVELVLLSDVAQSGEDTPEGWSFEELEEVVSERTRVVAISHVQFASGFAADLARLGAFCKERNIDLIVDCAQSLGCLPVYPEEYNIAAVASSGWKWLMGPFGAGVMYTSQGFRSKLSLTMGGPGMMKQGLNYLDHTWDPHTDGRMFEFSAAPWDHIAALDAVISQVFLKNSMEDIRDEIFRLQDIFLDQLDTDLVSYQLPPAENRSGIITMKISKDPQHIMKEMYERGVVITGPTGVLRLAPHFYMKDEQMVKAASTLNNVLSAS